jgi:hypothetical protein
LQPGGIIDAPRRSQESIIRSQLTDVRLALMETAPTSDAACRNGVVISK